MGVFFVLILVPMFVQHIVIGNEYTDLEKKNKRALLFFFLMLTVLLMLRHESVGNDTRTYAYFFDRFCTISWDQVLSAPIEIGFSYFNKLVSVFTSDSQVFFAITAIITSAMIYPTYRRLCLDSSLTIIIFCTLSTFVMMFSGLRQMLAIGIGVIAYEFTRNKKIIPFILCVVLAVSFHTSAFVLAFMYPLYYAKISKKWLLAVVPAITTVFIFNEQIFSVLALFIERYTEYDSDITKTGAYTMIILFAIFAAFAFVIPDESLLDEETVGLRNFLLFSLVIQLFAPLHPLAMRMNYYYIIFIPLLLPKIISCRSKLMDQIAIWGRHIMVVFFLVYFFISAYGGENLNVFPYHFFWETV